MSLRHLGLLSYRAAPRSHRRRNTALVAGALVLLTVTTSSSFCRSVFRQASYLVRQHAWMNHKLPGDAIVHEERLPEARRLVTSDARHYRGPRVGLVLPSEPAPEWASTASYYVPDFASVFDDVWENGIVFLHARQAPSGKTRLICVTSAILPDTDDTPDHLVYLDSRCFVPATWNIGSRAKLSDCTGNACLRISPQQHLIIFAAQPDANDLSHWTMSYAVDDSLGTFDCWLRNPTHEHPTEWMEIRPREGSPAIEDLERKYLYNVDNTLPPRTTASLRHETLKPRK